MDASFRPFPQAVWGGVITVNVFGILASAALCSVFLRIAWLAAVAFKTRQQPPEFVFFKTQLGVYAANLLLSNLVIAGSGLVNMLWLVRKGIAPGDVACIAQAITMQIGNVAAAYFTVAISVHTFITLVLQVGQSNLAAFSFILLGWVTAGVVGVTPHFQSAVYGPSGISCAVKTIFTRSQFFLHLLPVFISALLSALLSALIFLVLRGTLVVKDGFKLTLDPERRISRSDLLEQETYNAFVLAIAKAILWVPIAYVTFLGPYSVTKMLMLAGFKVPLEAQVFAAVCWFMIGVVNVLLLYNIFRVLGPVIAIRSQLTTPGSVERSPYTPSFISSGFSEKQQDLNRRPSAANSIMTTASSHPLIRHDSPNGHVGQPIIPNMRTNEKTAAFFHDVAEVPPSYSSPYYSRHNSATSVGSRNPIQGPALSRYPTPTRGVPVHATASNTSSDRTPTPQSGAGPSSPDSPASTFSVPKPLNSSVPRDLDFEPPATMTADHYPRASYFETYYGTNYLPTSRSSTYSTKLRPLLLQGSLRDK